MPWCEPCARYHAPSALREDGACPVCGGPVGDSEDRAARAAEDETTPWHFKLLVVATVVYLGWRLVQLFV